MNRSNALVVGMAIIMVGACAAAKALAQENWLSYHSSKGFAFKYPQSWLAVDKDTRDNVRREVQERFPSLRNFDFSAVDVIVLDSSDGYTNLNVVIIQGKLPISESTREERSEAVVNEYRSLGLTSRDVSSKTAQYAGRDCFVFSHRIIATGKEIAQTQYFVPGKDVTYIVTCSSDAEKAQDSTPLFENIMQTFEVTGYGLSAWARLPVFLQWAIIGGAIGLVSSIFAFIFKQKSRARQQDKNPPAE